MSTMDAHISEPIQEVWSRQCAAFSDALAEATEALRDLLRLDQYHRHGHDPEELERALGPLAASHLDLGALSKTLGGATAPRAMSSERLARVQGLVPALEQMKDTWSTATLDEARMTLAADEVEILGRAEAHFDRLASVFRAVRIAQLEIRAKYEPERHDALFADFDWRKLGPGELRLSPPFVVTASFDEDGPSQLQKVMRLLEAGMPIKILAMRSGVGAHREAKQARRPAPGLTVEMLPMAMWGVYLVQTPWAAPGFEERLLGALASPRPAVLSVLCPRSGEEAAAFQARAERAQRARAFPSCTYDPDQGERLGLCLDISASPAAEAGWTSDRLVMSGAEDEPLEIEEPFTFAHFAASEPGFEGALSDAPEADDTLVPLTDFMARSRQQQLGKRPFIHLAQDGTIVRKIVSDGLMWQCAERFRVWRNLQEISGVDNPHVSRTRAAMQKEIEGQRADALQNLRAEMEKNAADRERAAVASTVRKLVARLTGVDPASN